MMSTRRNKRIQDFESKNMFNQSLNLLENLMYDTYSTCVMYNYKSDSNNQIIVNDYIEKNSKHHIDLLSFYSIKMEEKYFDLIDEITIKLRNEVLWSFKFDFLLSMGKYENGMYYFPDKFFFENSNFIPLVSMDCWNFTFSLTTKNNKPIFYEINTVELDNSKNRRELCVPLIMIPCVYKINLYNNYPELTKGIYVSGKNISSSQFGPVQKINVKKLLNSNYKLIYKLNLPNDIIKYVLEYLIDHVGLFYVDVGNNCLELDNSFSFKCDGEIYKTTFLNKAGFMLVSGCCGITC